MAAPNIESIAASLRKCSLNGGKRAAPLNQPATVESEEVTVELNSDAAFPYHWKQYLDITTGELFYENWKNGTRTTEDPRIADSRGLQASYYSSEDYTSDDDEIGEDNDGDVEDCSSLASAGDGTDYDDLFGVSSRNSYSSSSFASSPNYDSGGGDGGEGDLILVVAGCRFCFMYFMVPKHFEACPKCGGCLLHLGQNGYY